MEIIISKDNVTLKKIRKLMRSKKERSALNQFAIEGIKLVEEALKSQIPIAACLVTDSFFSCHQELMVNLIPRVKRLCKLSDHLEVHISTNPTPQGVYCICSLPKLAAPNHQIHTGKHLALIQIQDPSNLGVIIRTAEAFSIDRIYISTDSVDLFCPKVIRASMGSCFRQKITILDDIHAFLAECKALKFPLYAATISRDAQDISQTNFGEDAVVFIGNEGNGLPEKLTSNIEHHTQIPIASHVDSLNVGVAAGIIAFYLTNSKQNP